MFRDSPTCLNFKDPSRPNACSDCHLMKFVPKGHSHEDVAFHYIPLNEDGEAMDNFERYGTQAELEEATAQWLRKEISRMEQERAQKVN